MLLSHCFTPFGHTTKCLVAWMKALLKTIKTPYTKENNMLYAIWVIGVLFAIGVSAKITMNKERSGQFDE